MHARRDRGDRRLLLAGVAGGPLFLAVFTSEGTRREGYEPQREPVSALALRERGWVQQTNFLATGLLMPACSQGLRRLPAVHPARSRWGSRLALYALGLLGSGMFVTDPVRYGKSDPDLSVVPSRAGVPHNVFGLLVFGPLTAASWVCARRFAAQGARGLAEIPLSGPLFRVQPRC